MERNEIYERSFRHFLRPIVPLLDDPAVSEIMTIGPDTIYFERGGQIIRSEAKFSDEAALMAAVRNIAEYVNRFIDSEHHSMDARLPTGERVHVIIAPASRCGTCLTIRKFQRRKLGFAELVAEGVLSQAAADVIEFAVKLHRNIVVSGGTGTGKTTLLNAFSEAIPSAERIIVIEDSSELKLQQPHTIYLEAQVAGKRGAAPITIRDLFVDSLRMRPDRIVVGEVRRGEALDLIQSMLSGHSGALTTVHANSPRDAASRLETLCLLSDAELPIRVARSQVASAIHLVIQLARFVDGSRRVVAVWESRGLNDQEQYTWNPLFHFQPNHEGADCPKGVLKSTRNIPDFLEDAYQYGLADDANHLKERLVLAA